MLSIQTEQYFPLYKFTWEKLQSTNEGTWAGKRKYQEVGKNKKQNKIQADTGLRDNRETTTSIWVKINVFLY